MYQESTQPAPIHSESTPVNQTPSSKSKFPMILMVIILLILFTGVGIILGKVLFTSQIILIAEKTQPLSSPTQVGISSPTPTTNPVSTISGETANWKTYTNPAYSFSFKYPSTWSFEEKLPNSISFLNQDKNFALIVDYKKAGDSTRIVRTGVGAGDLVTRGTVKFNDVNLTRDVLVYQNNDKEVLYNKAFEIKTGNLVFSISLTDNTSLANAILTQSTEQEADQILSTFKFTL